MQISLHNTDLFILGFAAIANLVLGFVVYFQNTKSLTNRLLFFFTIAGVLWGALNYLSYQPASHATTLLLVRGVLFFAVPFAQAFFFLMYVFPKDQVQYSKRILFGIVAVGLLAMALTLSPYTFTDVITGGTAPQPLIGWGILVFFIGAVVPIVLGLFTLFRKYFHTQGPERQQFKFLLLGVLLMFGCIIALNFIFPIALSNTNFIQYGALFTLPFVILTTYAILRHHLLNVRVISTEILVFFILSAILVDILTATTVFEVVVRVLIFVLLIILSMFLIRSVLNEVRQREQLEILSKQLEAANDQLKAIDQAKTEFLSVASHQLRTPLTAIKGYVSMLLEGDFGAVGETQRETLQTIFESSQRLVALISDLLDLSRIESGRMEFDFDKVDLCKVVDGIIEELSQKAKDKGLYLFFDQINRSCPEIKADSEKIRQALINLIDNAVKYTLTGGVTVSLIQSGDNLRFSVADTGIGVDPKDKPRLFEKFFRTDAASAVTHEGTGLGIYVVKKIVEAHGGKIWFDSAGSGKGTTFFVDLPIPKGPIVPERVKVSSLEAF